MKIMRSHYLHTLFILTLFSVSCAYKVSTHLPESQHRSEDLASTQSLNQFLTSFRSALKKNDVSEISRMTRFPIDVGLAGTEGFEGIEHQEGFARHYRTLFPEPAIRTLLKESPQPIHADDELGKDAVEGWTISHNEPNEISEFEWSIIYYFSRFADGDIRLTAIHFAG
jgi:hypothetical protein